MPTVKSFPDTKIEAVRESHLPFTSIALALLCCLLWGGNSVAAKVALEYFPPFAMAGLRFGLAAVAIGIWCAAKRAPLAMQLRQWPIVLVNGVLLYLQIGTFSVGTKWSTSIHSIILVNAYPFFTALATHFWMPEYSLTRSKVIGLFIAFAGVVLLFAEQITLPDRDVALGDLLLLCSALVLGIKFTYVKTVLGKVTVPRIVFWEATIAVPLFFLTSLLSNEGPQSRLTPAAAIGIAYQALAVSGVAFMVWTLLLAKHSPNTLAAISFTTPLFGMVAGALLLGEPVTPTLVVGGVLIVAGIYRINSRST